MNMSYSDYSLSYSKFLYSCYFGIGNGAPEGHQGDASYPPPPTARQTQGMFNSDLKIGFVERYFLPLHFPFV